MNTSDTTEYAQDAKPIKDRRILRTVIATVAAAVVAVAISWGGIAWADGVATQRAHIAAVAFKHSAAQSLPQMQANTAAAGDESDTSSADQAVQAEQAREAAAALAAEQAAAAAEAAREATHSASSYAPGEAPAGTPIPTHLDTDPNSGTYGQQVIEDPGFFCASKSGNTVNGVAVCA